MKYFRDKRVFITGGSSGIGLAAARQLVTAGAHVSIAARGQGRLDAACEELRSLASPEQNVHAIALDVGDFDAVLGAADEVVESLGGIDVIINNAGIAHPATVAETPTEVYESMMRVNYFGTVNVTRAFLPRLKEQGNGHIANVSSMLGFMGIYGYTAYAASKHAVVGFSDALRQELIGHGIGLTVVFPPDTDTPQLHEENKIKPPETKAIAGEVKMMTADAVADVTLRAIARNQYHVVPGAMGTFTYFMYRHAPGVVRFVIDWTLRRYQRDQKKAVA